MYRICRATSGSYYAQAYGHRGWKKFGPFCRTRQGARNVIAGAQHHTQLPYFDPPGRVVEYV